MINVKQQVHHIICNTIQNIYQTPDDLTFWHSEKFDSMDCLLIVVKCEDKFNIHITNQEIKTLKTVGDLVKLIETKIDVEKQTLPKAFTTKIASVKNIFKQKHTIKEK